MKFNVLKVNFKGAVTAFGSSAWYSTVRQGGYDEAELDTDTGILTFWGKSPLETRRIHVSNTSDMVFGPTKAAAVRKE